MKWAEWVNCNPFAFLGLLLSFFAGIFFVGLFAASQGAPQPLPPLIRSQYDERLLALDKAAIEQAYSDQVRHVFEIWMKDETGQPMRAVTGVRNAQKGYISSMDAIKLREEEIKKRQ